VTGVQACALPILACPAAEGSPPPEEGARAVARFIEQFPVEGPIRLESETIRAYPHGPLAAHVIGYVRDTDELPPNVQDLAEIRSTSMQKLRYTGKTGAAGVELSYDSVLKGLSGWELWTKTSSGYNQTRLKASEPEQGSHVMPSLDYRTQLATERALAQIKDSKGELLPAAAVMRDARTGEILAMASQPTFDPNRMAGRISQADYDEVESRGAWLNRSTQGLYPPGSTFKVITAIAGMRRKVVDWDDILECGPSFRVGDRDFPEHEPVGYGDVNLDKMLAVSCNVWNYQVGLRTGPPAPKALGARQPFDHRAAESRHPHGRPRSRVQTACRRGSLDGWRHRQHIDRPRLPAHHAAPHGLPGRLHRAWGDPHNPEHHPRSRP